ncbi:MAG TPA: hypothetical protein VG318_16320 [Actinomycetota bacterium]|nr:hypothetical protein [Actinomycetota bacterium]
MRKITILLAVLLVMGAAPALAAKGEHCGAITLADKPPLGEGSRFDWSDHQDAHNWFIGHRRHVFASGYVSGKHYYVGFTRKVCRHLRHIRSMVDEGWRFQAFVAKYSWAQLARTQRCVGDLPRQEWLRIGGSDRDVHMNQVIVWLREKTDGRKHYIRHRCPDARIVFYEGGTVPG